jgi:ABC-type uncharacterized transport system permease subunit
MPRAKLLVAAADGTTRRFAIDDHHPEAGWRAFFGKVWYEGGDGAGLSMAVHRRLG